MWKARGTVDALATTPVNRGPVLLLVLGVWLLLVLEMGRLNTFNICK